MEANHVAWARWPQGRRWRWMLGVGLVLSWLVVNWSWAGPPWSSLLPFKRVEANPQKSYALTEADGPWLILCASFAGTGAEEQAHTLALELRKRFGWEAYVHRRTYDFTEPVRGMGLDRRGSPKKMRHQYDARFEEIAVLVGHFKSVDDRDLQKTLEKIKYAKPDTLQTREGKTTQRFVVWREMQRQASPDDSQKQKGPMGGAFVTRNPLLPEEYFKPSTVDPLVAAINRQAEYSLFECPGRYTVRVATFRGKVTMKVDEIESLKDQRRPWGNEKSLSLEEAALKANRLAGELRKQGVEAYEFHDRHESIVTVGSFDEIGSPRVDGKIEINPAVLRVMEMYKADLVNAPGLSGAAVKPKTMAGVAFDAQPYPVETPKLAR